MSKWRKNNKPIQFKFAYQLLTSQLVILSIAFIILSFSFSKFVENYIFENTVDELMDFGQEITKNLVEDDNVSMTVLKEYTDMLGSRNIRFFVFQSEGKIIYPNTTKAPAYLLEETEWNDLKKGNIVVNKRDAKRFDHAVSLVSIPVIKENKFAGGVLMIAPITGTMTAVKELNKILINTIIIAFSVVILFSILFSTNLIKRITQLRKAASMIMKGNYDVHLTHSYIDEFTMLTEDFNLMARKLKKSDEEIVRLENRRKKFIADLSHEMRTPLTTISGVADGIQSKLIAIEEIDKAMDLINRESKRLIRLVNESLDYEKIRSNNLVLHKFNFSLQDVLQVIEEQLSIVADEKNNKLVVKCDEKIQIFADYDRLIQILVNIVKNGIQFTENGLITLEGLETEEETIIIVSDTGMGIDKEEIELIWDRFYKADLSRTGNDYGQFGIGLSIVKQLVHLHGGTVQVTSEKNVGTSFSIRFPKNVELSNEVNYENSKKN